jgi:hypothetical protein
MVVDSNGTRPANQIELKRSHRYTWMMNGWTNNSYLDDVGGGTEFTTIGVPDDFVAVRVGFANINTEPWTVRKIIACASSSWNDSFNPVDDTRTPRVAEAWSTLTFQNAGSDRDSLVTAAGAPVEIAVAGNGADPAMGETSNPFWTFTDWVPCASAAADPATGMRILMLRALIPGNQEVTFTNGKMTEYAADPSINNGYGYFTGGLKRDTDLVTDPAPQALHGMRASTLRANHLVNGQLISLVQVLTRNAGIVGLITGDSHQAGTSTTSNVNKFLTQCLLGIGRGTIGTVPVGVVSTASGGLSSQQFFPRMTTLLDTVRPSFVVLPGWSYNELDRGAYATASAEHVLFVRMILAADQVRAAGAIPIFTTPFPRNRAAMTPAVMDGWLAQRDAILAMRRTGEFVFDATPLLGAVENGRFTGTYLDGLSSDAIHPNNKGHAILARAMAPMVEGITGLPPAACNPQAAHSSSWNALSGPDPGADDEDGLGYLLSRLRWHEG